MADVFDIAGRINSTSNEHVVTTADQIKDEDKNKKQSQINAETISELATHESRLNAYTEGKFVTVDTYSGLPATGVVDTVYRVSSWDGTANSGQGAVDVTKYSEYAWENGAYKFLDVKTQIGEVFDISEYNNDTYTDLADALSGTNVPQDVRRGGMSVKFVRTSDHKYVQYRLTADEWSINTDDWQDENCVSTQESLRYIISLLDGNDNMIIGITKEGKLVCDDSLLQDVGVIKAKVNISDIVDNLTTESIVVPLSANQGVRINERIVSLEQSYTFITNDIYLFAIVDADEKVLWGIKRDGKLDEPTRLEDSLNWLFALTDGDDKVCFGIRKDNSIYAPGLIMPNYDAEIAELHEDISENTEAIVDVQEDLEKFKSSTDTIEVAIGRQKSYGTYLSELAASPIINSSDNYNVGYKVIGKDKMKHDIAKSFVVFNHDDGFIGDLTATRRIYNKYGFKASICAIFQPFASLNDAKVRIENFKKWLNDGHEIGLHAIMNSSYWYYNRVNDVRPDGSTSFAPQISELRGSNVDGTGVNTFGTTITADTTIRNAGISGSGVYASEYLDTKVVEATQVQLDDVLRGYCFYGDRLVQNGIESLEINIDTATSASVVGKTRIQWLEYFYNRLIDNTIGYSSTSTDIATRFAEDYDFPSGESADDYYPDTTHMLNGKMVYYGDTTNPHYSDSSYQKVGKFKKGIFKGCFTCCNYEILDRVVEVAQAFFRHYYGLNHFTDMHRHGGGYYSLLYIDDGIYYLNREKTILYDNHGKFFVSHRGTWLRGIDTFNEQGIEMLKDTSYRTNLSLEGEAGFYYGQKGIRTEHGLGGFANGYGNYVNYLAMFGSGDTGMEDMSVSTFNTYMEGVDNWLKFCYENADQNVTQNGLTMKVYSYIKGIVQQVAGSIGTGKITQISVDTIKNSPAIFAAVDILLRFFKDNGIECLSYETGMDKILSMDRDISGNLFPNAGFNQTVLEYFGGSSNSNKAYIPDGWNDINASNTENFSVGNETVNGIDTRVLTISGKTNIMTNILGLPQGDYKLSYDIKSSITGFTSFRSIKIGDKKNTYTVIDNYDHTSEWVTKEVEFSINAPHRNMVDESDPVSVISDGYDDNIFRLAFILSSSNADNVMKLANVKLYKI